MRFKAVLGPLVLVLVSTLIALAVGELLARFVFPPVPQTLDDRLGASNAYEAHPVLGWRPRPNVTQKFRRFDATFTTNSRGLRDREHALEPTPGLKRIVVLGDSFTWGYGVNDNEVFARIVESRLPGTELVNLGVVAYGLRQEFDYFKLEGVLYKPDMVILALCQNDIYRPGRSPQEIFAAQHAPRQRAPTTLAGRAKEWLSENVVLYKLAKQAINSNRWLVKTLAAAGLKEELHGFEGMDNNLMPALRVYPPALQRSFEMTQAELLEIRDWLAERRIDFFLALIPAHQAIDAQMFQHSISYTVFEPADFDLAKPYRELEAFAKANGIPVLNAYPALKRRAEGGATLYLRNDQHFNAAGHEAFAGELVARLQASK